MLGRLLGIGVPKIKSLDDLQNERARAIAKQYGLDVREILPQYLELTKEVMANGGKLEIDLNNPNLPLNIHQRYRRAVACGAVLGYELTSRKSMKFPVAEEPAVIGIGEEAFLAAVKVKGNIHRTTYPETYQQLGEFYEKVMEILDKHQEANLEKVLEG